MLPPAYPVELNLLRPASAGLRRFINWLAAARSHRVLCLVVAVWVLNAFDLTLTLIAHRQHLLHEVNPLAEQLLAHGEIFLALFKFGLLAIGTYALIRFRRERITELGCLLIIGIYMMVAMQWHLCYEMYALTVNCGPDVAHLWRPAQAGLSAWGTQPR